MWMTLSALLVPLALLRWQAPIPERSAPWRWPEVLLCVGLGLVFAGLCAHWMSLFFLKRGGLNASDFAQYCDSVGAVQSGVYANVHPQRSLFAALIPGVLARVYGVMGGFMLTALLSQAVLGSALYVWGRSVAGPMAGLASVIIALAMSPIVLLTRNTTFYPQFVATTAVLSAALALAITRRGPGQLAALGAAAGLVLLWDVRGFYWAVPALGVGAVMVFAPERGFWGWRRALGKVPLRALALLVPVAISWQIAHQFTPKSALGLTSQTYFFAREVMPSVQQPAGYDDLIWGRTAISAIPAGLMDVRSANAAVVGAPTKYGGAVGWFEPWRWPTLALVAALVVLRRRNVEGLLAFALPAVPYLAALYSAVAVIGHPRYLASGFPVVAVAFGAGVAAVLTGEGGRVPVPLRVPLASGVLLLLVLGIVPSWLSPIAKWRFPQFAEQYPLALLSSPPSPQSFDLDCLGMIEADRAALRSYPLYPGTIPAP